MKLFRVAAAAWPAVLIVQAACAGGTDALPVPGGLLELLERKGVPYDLESVRRASVEAVLRLVDPRVMFAAPASDAVVPSDPEADVIARRWPGGVGYIRPIGTYAMDGACIDARLRSWSSDAGMEGAILDLRGTAGVDMGCVCRVAGSVVGPGVTLAKLFDRRGRDAGMLVSQGEAIERAIPLILLVDGETSGAAEALAAFLKGRKGVMLLGGRTAGDAFARERVAVDGQLAAYLATSAIRVEGGPDYADRGVEADIAVEAVGRDDATPPAFDDDGATARDLMAALAGDAVLRRAVDIVLGLKAVRIEPVTGAVPETTDAVVGEDATDPAAPAVK